jgi:L-glutamine-phosphate cytidylyltransferase
VRAIIIAAGQGTRLRPHTADRPKCMVEVGGRPIIHHQVAAYRAAGIDDIVVIRGYKGRRMQIPGRVRYVDNKAYRDNNILESLFCAGPLLLGDVMVSYGDIVFHPGVVDGLKGVHAPATLVVDRAWADTYEGRTDHPVDQAELVKITHQGLVSRVGKSVGAEGAVGEFIGLASFTGPVLARLWALYLAARSKGVNEPYGTAPSLRKAYLTDLLNTAIDEGEMVAPLGIDGHWREIDTVQDLERAAQAVTW